MRELGLAGGRERRLLREILARLTAAGKLRRIDEETWGLPETNTDRGLVAGKLDLHRDGYGFVRPDGAQGREQDIFIPPMALGGAMQGDRVWVELDRGQQARRSGRVTKIAERRASTVVGIFHYGSARKQTRRKARRARGDWQQPIIPAGFHYVSPLDERMTQPVLIADGDEMPPDTAATVPHRVLGAEAHAQAADWDADDLEGLAVNVELTHFPTQNSPARGRVVEVLGEEDAFGVDVEIVIRKHHLPHVFPDDVLREAQAVARWSTSPVARRDFRSLPIVTIDGETARDFDDAVYVEDLPGGNVQLQVHIADVAHYVADGGALDREARLRGTSVYFPDRAVPMLPQELSSDACSLRPHEDRLVLSAVMEFDREGNRVGYELAEGLIRSAARMTYAKVAAILDGDVEAREEYVQLAPRFDRMLEFAKVLNRKRVSRGSIDFDLPEPVIEFDELGAMQGISRAERHWSHRIIEEFMLAANECVAQHLEKLAVASLYRIHEKPEPARVLDFEEAASAFGYSLGVGHIPVRRFAAKGDRRDAARRNQRNNFGKGGHLGRGNASRPARTHEVVEDIAVTPKMYQHLAARIAGKPEERVMAMLMLRSLKQARYSERNEGHFALAADSYTHFTSPIRRYPDLIVHRIIRHTLSAGAIDFLPEVELASIAKETSDAERRAADAERELIEWKKVRFMEDRVGEEFDALIISVTKYGFFVELEEMFLEGLVPLQTLSDLGERFTYRENTREIAGEETGRAYRVGDKVRVLLDRILRMEKRLQFAIVDTAPKPKQTRRKTRRW